MTPKDRPCSVINGVLLTVGDMIPLKGDRDVMAQLEDIHRTNGTVRYVYGGKLARARVRLTDLAKWLTMEPPLITRNMFDLGLPTPPPERMVPLGHTAS